MSYIHYDEKPNGAIYACIYESYRDKGKVKTRRGENLGRVIDKENNIFRQNGITYQYIIGEGRKEVNAIYDIFKVQVPYKIPLTTIEV